MSKMFGLFICSICNRKVEGWTCNAEPINNGRCCQECDQTIVIPARFRRLQLDLPLRECRYDWEATE